MIRTALRVSFVVMSALACGASAAPTSTSAPATQPAMKAIDYRLTGGFAGFNDRITISADGAVEVNNRDRVAKGQLTPGQMEQLAQILAGWEKLADKYPADPNVADDMYYQIAYGGKTVLAAGTSAGVPEQFHRARAKIEELARAAAK
jgi:hypothetical protein